MNLTLNYYTQWYWKINLHNLLHFLHLRVDPHAQWEIRAYGEVMLALVSRWVPLTVSAFRAYRMEGVSLSKGALQVIQKRLRGESVSRETSGLSLREWRELMATLGEAP
jgi:thymidylate synthase (FAD)